MANLQGYELTVTGRALLAKAGTGACTLNFTKVKLGADETSLNDLINKTDLVGTNIKQIDIVGSKANEATFTIIATVTNSGMQNNFLIRQVGIFAKGVAATNPGTGVTPEDINETLFAVAYDTQPDIIPAESITPYTRQFNANMTVTNVEQCNVTLTPSGVVTVQVLNNHNDNSEAHGNLIKRIFGSASATMDSIKNKINEWSKEVCLPLSGGELTGDITANNVYANNNVLVFNNVAEMKASNKVKAGYTLKTLGFYTAGDGGGADYVVTDNINEDEADEASIIALQKGLYAKLQVQDCLNVKQFGAKGDGETDDTIALQVALDFQKKNINFDTDTKCYTGNTIYMPKGTYYITSPLIFYTGAGGIKADSATLKVKENVSGVQINSIYLENYMPAIFSHSQNNYEIKGLRIISLSPNYNGDTVGIEFAGDRNIIKSCTSFVNLMISGFSSSLKGGNSTWNNVFIKCSFFNNKRCVLMPNVNTIVNAFERWDFYSCVFANGLNGIENYNSNGVINLINCSLDYLGGNCFYLANGAQIYATNCWIEWIVRTNREYIGVLKNVDGIEVSPTFKAPTLLDLKNCKFNPMYRNGNDLKEDEKYTHGLFFCDIDYTFPTIAGLRIQNCYSSILSAPEIVTGGGQVVLKENYGYFDRELPDKVQEDIYNLENISFIPYGIRTDQTEAYTVNLNEGILTLEIISASEIKNKCPTLLLNIKDMESFTLDINLKANKSIDCELVVRRGYGYINPINGELIKIFTYPYSSSIKDVVNESVGTEFKNFKVNLLYDKTRATDRCPFPLVVWFDLYSWNADSSLEGLIIDFNKIEILRRLTL